jgi:hypothetical protein
MGKSLFALLAALLVVVLTSGCLEGELTCPEEEGMAICGVCSDTGRCVYCSEGMTCASDICGTPECIAPRMNTALFRVADGQPVPGNVVLADGSVGYTQESWFVITGENGEPLEGYAYSVEDPVGKPLPPGLTLSPDGKLSGLPASSGDYVFGVCATSPAGEKTCRDVPMRVSAPYVPPATPHPLPNAPPTTPPTPPPSETPLTSFKCSGITEMHSEPYNTYLVMQGALDDGCAEDCNQEKDYTFDIRLEGNKVTGTVTSTVLGVFDCEEGMSAFKGQTFAEPIYSGTATDTADGCKFTFSTRPSDMSAIDYTLTVDPSGGDLHIETCHSPDERCTCYTPDPRCHEIEQEGYPGEGAISTMCWWATE